MVLSIYEIIYIQRLIEENKKKNEDLMLDCPELKFFIKYAELEIKTGESVLNKLEKLKGANNE